MNRLRHRPDYFWHRGDRFSFHRHQDGATLGRLDPYADGEQDWPLHSGRLISVTAEEVRDISFQVHGLRLPATRPGGSSCNCAGRIDAIEARLAALEAAKPEATAEAPPYIDLSERSPEEESPIPSPAVVALDKMEALKARMDAGRKMIPDEIGELMEAGETIAEARDRLTPKLNSELSKLKNLRGFAGQDLAREAEIETLLGMLSRLGEG